MAADRDDPTLDPRPRTSEQAPAEEAPDLPASRRGRVHVELTLVASDGRVTFTVAEIATLVGIGHDGVYAAADRGEIPGEVRIGGRRVFRRAEVLAWLGIPAPSEPE